MSTTNPFSMLNGRVGLQAEGLACTPTSRAAARHEIACQVDAYLQRGQVIKTEPILCRGRLKTFSDNHLSARAHWG